MNPKREKTEDDSPRLEKIDWLLIATIAVVLSFCVWPELFDQLIWLIDVRNWSQMAWFVVNTVVIVVLFFIIARRNQN
jgi:cytochrome bd-type quinol oxidase subunit 2